MLVCGICYKEVKFEDPERVADDGEVYHRRCWLGEQPPPLAHPYQPAPIDIDYLVD